MGEPSLIEPDPKPVVLSRVAMIEPVGGHSGMDYYDAGLCQGLAAAGVRVMLFTCDETDASEGVETYRPYRNIYGDAPVLARAWRYCVGTLRSLRKARQSKSEIAHFHFFNIGVLEFFNVIATRLAGLKSVATIHDVQPLTGRRMPFLRAMVLRLLDGAIVHNQTSYDDLRPEDAGMADVVIIPHGNYAYEPDEILDKRQARQQLGLPEGGKILLFFGQIKPSKGLDLLLDALPEIQASHEDVRLVVAGRRAKDFAGINLDRAYVSIFDHYIPNEQVATFFAASDLVVLPYRRIYQSGVLLNSMSIGRAVLASDLPAMQEIITDGTTGFLFKSDDSNSLAYRAIELLDDPEWLAETAESAHEYVTAFHSWGQIGWATAQFYQDVLKGNGTIKDMRSSNL